MTSQARTPRRRHAPLPKSRYEVGVELKRDREKLGMLVIAVDTALRDLNSRIEKAIAGAQSYGGGSIVGSEVQVPQRDPAPERAFDWLETVRQEVTTLVGQWDAG